MAFTLLTSVKNFLTKGSPQVGAVGETCHHAQRIITLKSVSIFYEFKCAGESLELSISGRRLCLRGRTPQRASPETFCLWADVGIWDLHVKNNSPVWSIHKSRLAGALCLCVFILCGEYCMSCPHCRGRCSDSS